MLPKEMSYDWLHFGLLVLLVLLIAAAINYVRQLGRDD
jgi:hypothetical protein